jgi:hypothetical protein
MELADHPNLLTLPGPALSRTLALLDPPSLRSLRQVSPAALVAASGAFSAAAVVVQGSSTPTLWRVERRYPRLRRLRLLYGGGATATGGCSAEQRLLSFFGCEGEDDDDDTAQQHPSPLLPWRGRLTELDLSCAVPHLSTPGAAARLADAIARLCPGLVSLALPPVLPPGGGGGGGGGGGPAAVAAAATASAAAVAREQGAALSELARLPHLKRLRARGWWPLRDPAVLSRLDALPALEALDLGEGDPAAAMGAGAGEPLARFRLLDALPRVRRRLRHLRLGGGGKAVIAVGGEMAAAAQEQQLPAPPEQDEGEDDEDDDDAGGLNAAAAAAGAAAAFALAPNLVSLAVAPLPGPPQPRRARAMAAAASADARGSERAAAAASAPAAAAAPSLVSWPAPEINAVVAALAPLSRLQRLEILWHEEGEHQGGSFADEDDEDGGSRSVVAPPLEEEAAAAAAASRLRRRRSTLDQEAASRGSALSDARAIAAAAATASAAAHAAAAAALLPVLPLTSATLDLWPLASLRLLSCLSVGGVALRDGCVAALSALPALRRLRCRGFSVGGGGAGPLLPAPARLCCAALTKLEVRGGGFEVGRGGGGEQGAAPLTTAATVLPALCHLRLGQLSAPDPPDLACLRAHPALAALELEACSAHWDLNAALNPALAVSCSSSSSVLGSIPNLRRLRLADGLGSELRQWRPPRCPPPRAALPTVRALELAGSAGDQALAAVPRLFPALARLRLEGARLATDAGMRHVAASLAAAGVAAEVGAADGAAPSPSSPLRELQLVRCPRVSEYGLALLFMSCAGGGGGGDGGVTVSACGCERLTEEACARVRRGVLLRPQDEEEDDEGGGSGCGELVWSPPSGSAAAWW